MKFKAQVGGLMAGMKPMITIASKGKDCPTAGFITLNSFHDRLEVVANGGFVSGSNTISNTSYNIDFSCENEGSVTIKASDLYNAMASFSNTDNIYFELFSQDGGGQEVIITSQTDKDEFQTIAVAKSENTCMFIDCDNDDNEKVNMNIRKDIFFSYANKILFAHGDGEGEKQKAFNYWILRSYGKTGLRFVAGTGTFFAVVEVEGENLTDNTEKNSIYFPNSQTAAILSILNDLNSNNISISSQKSYILMECGSAKISIYACDPEVKWPDENLFLNRSSKFNITTKAGNWRNAVKGITATNNEEAKTQDKVHNCYLNIDFDKKFIQTKTDTTLKSVRKITIEDVGTNEEQKEIKINCVSKYLSHVLSKSQDEEYLQFEIEDSSKPVIIRYYASKDIGDYRSFKKPKGEGISERYSVFFATMKS